MAKSDVDFAQSVLENAHICIVFLGHLSFLPACAAILDFKNVTPLVPSRRSIPPISMVFTSQTLLKGYFEIIPMNNIDVIKHVAAICTIF